mmetsp:Transcript_38695/g.84267  ORF Transcript_38695/g.84267 Transcript_38695/m.84267 type:complete len:383 (-) Transcript_38695:46-1194(-)
MSHSGRSMARNHFKQSKQRPSWASVCDSSSSDTDMKLFDNDKGAALLESTRPDTGNMWMVQDVPCGAVDDRLAERSDYGDGGEVLEMPFKHSKHCQSLDSVCDSPDDNAMRRTANEPGAALLEKTWSDVSTTCTVHSFKGNRVLRGAMDNILASNNGDRTDDSEVLPMAFVHFEKRQSWDSVSDSFDDDDVLEHIANDTRVALRAYVPETSTTLAVPSLNGNNVHKGAANNEMTGTSEDHGDGGEVFEMAVKHVEQWQSWDSACDPSEDDITRRIANKVGADVSENAGSDTSTSFSAHCLEGNHVPSGTADSELAASSGDCESLSRSNLEAQNVSGRRGEVPLAPPKVLQSGKRQCVFIEFIFGDLFDIPAVPDRRSCRRCA